MIWSFLFAIVYPLLHTGGDPAGLTKVPAPGVRYRMNMATATSAPWVDSNMWRYRRHRDASYFCDVRGKSVSLAMAEAFAVGAKVSLQTDPSQQAGYDAMLAFLKQIPAGPVQPWANLAVTDDGSFQAGEILNLLSRRNLLFTTAPAKGTIPVELTSKMSNAYEAMQEIREKLGDDKRILRIFGSELTMAELAREGSRIRLHLVNYGSRPVETLRIRLQGKYTEKNIQALVYNHASPRFSEFVYENGFTEFTLDKFPLYAVLDLQ